MYLAAWQKGVPGLLQSPQDLQGQWLTRVGLHTKNNDGRESPHKRWKIVSKAVIAVSEDEVAKEMGKVVDEVDEDLGQDGSQGEEDTGSESKAETELAA